ncbi:MAG TPA: DinB family protein [Anaerolineaceae bacterium]|nr:DinB family protein [Anaerolineaceae bacterium]
MTNHPEIKAAIQADLDRMRARFHALLDLLSEDDFHRQSLNPGWTNGEVIAHMTFGLIIVDVLLPITRLGSRLPRGVSRAFAWILDALTGPFNWINELGARGQGRVMTRARVGVLFDRAYARLTKKVAAIQPDEWDRGMDYPAKWDPNFQEYMTLKDLFRYCVQHFDLHYQQVAYSA